MSSDLVIIPTSSFAQLGEHLYLLSINNNCLQDMRKAVDADLLQQIQHISRSLHGLLKASHDPCSAAQGLEQAQTFWQDDQSLYPLRCNQLNRQTMYSKQLPVFVTRIQGIMRPWRNHYCDRPRESPSNSQSTPCFTD